MWFKVATWLLPKVIGVGQEVAGRIIEQKGELQEQQHETRIAKERTRQAKELATAKAIEKAAETESISAANLTKGWKDEFSLMLFLTPLWFILIIFPVLAMVGIDTKPAEDTLQHGIEQLAVLPEWYWALIVIMVLKTFGVPVANIIGGIATRLFDRKPK